MSDFIKKKQFDFVQIQDLNSMYFRIPSVTICETQGESNMFQADGKMIEVTEDYMIYIVNEYWNRICDNVPGGRYFSRTIIESEILPDLENKIEILKESNVFNKSNITRFFANHDKIEKLLALDINSLYEKYEHLDQSYFLAIDSCNLTEASAYENNNSLAIEENRLLLASITGYSWEERQFLGLKFFREATLECTTFIYWWFVHLLKNEINGVTIYDV